MPRGRCAGCGQDDASAKKIERHIQTCPEFLALYKNDPARAITPVEEAQRHAAYLESEEHAEAKEAIRAERAAGYREKNAVRMQTQMQRWKSKKFITASHLGMATSTPCEVPVNGRLDSSIYDEKKVLDPARRVALKQREIRA